MRAVTRLLGGAAGIAILAACTSGQSGIQPPSNAPNVQQNSTLQFRVGTVNYQGTSLYTNTVVTFRQANGLSATLYNTPAITGPATWIIPATAPNNPASSSGAGTDAGTNTISGTQPTQPGTPAVATTFGQVGGAFAYGFAPANSSTTGASFYPGNPSGRGFNSALGVVSDIYPQPIYRTSGGKRPFVLGPPAVPDFHNPSLGFPAGFAGYDSGFMSFAVAPVVGTYSLHLTVPGPNVGQFTAVFDQTASIATIVPLGTEPSPPIAEVAAPGGAVNFTVGPAPAGATQQVLYVVDINGATGALTFYAFNAGAAGGTFSLPAADFHPGNSNPPANTTNDTVVAYVVGANWDVVGDAAPNNSSPAPPLPAQTDITISPLNAITYQ
ncbi:MAG TPA: hypothetical protein VK669_02145 [Candidatus Limnocylindrales bacterium]|nr:hypothetical protein [Candidatus Limnocylindrales bacterium]